MMTLISKQDFQFNEDEAENRLRFPDLAGSAMSFSITANGETYVVIVSWNTWINSPMVSIYTQDGTPVSLNQPIAPRFEHIQITKSVVEKTNFPLAAKYIPYGTPDFPDNVAGRTYWQDAWATTDGWIGIAGTVSVSDGALIGTATGTPFGVYRNVSGSANNIVRIKVKASITVLLQIQLKIAGTDTLVKTQNLVANQYSIIEFMATSAFTRIILFYTGASTGNTLSIDTIYIGSGAYDTAIPDISGNGNSLANTGCLPVYDSTLGRNVLQRLVGQASKANFAFPSGAFTISVMGLIEAGQSGQYASFLLHEWATSGKNGIRIGTDINVGIVQGGLTVGTTLYALTKTGLAVGWHRFTLSYDGNGGLAFYVDGVLAGSRSDIPAGWMPSVGTLRLMNSTAGIPCSVESAAVYPKAFTEIEAKEEYDGYVLSQQALDSPTSKTSPNYLSDKRFDGHYLFWEPASSWFGFYSE